MLKHCCTLVLILCVSPVIAQTAYADSSSAVTTDTAKTFRQKKFAGIVAGVSAAAFEPTTSFSMSLPSSIRYRVGVGFDLASTNFYACQLVLGYVRGGANERFESDGKTVESKILTHKAQVNFYPLVVRGIKRWKINPYVALGGFAGYAVDQESVRSINGGEMTEYNILNKENYEYGIAVSAGFYVFGNPVGLIYEQSLNQIIPGFYSRNLGMTFSIF